MPVPLSYAIARGGPLPSGSSYFGGGESFSATSFALNASQSVSVNGTSEQPIWLVPGVSPWGADGTVTDSANPGGALQAASPIGSIVQVRIGVGGVALAATLANLTLSLALRRAGSVVGGGSFAGWAAAGNAAIAAYTQIVMPMLPANTALIDPTTSLAATVASRAILPVQPGDIVTLVVATGAGVTVPFFTIWLDVV